jgi:hypothetical protein
MENQFNAYEVKFSYETDARTVIVAQSEEAARQGVQEILTKQGLKDVVVLDVSEYQPPKDYDFTVN